MSISRRQLYALGEPLGECVTEAGPDRRYKRMGGGGGGSTSTGTTYTSNIPEYAQQPFMNLVGKAEAISAQPYQPFTGQRIQGFDPLQNQSFGQAQGLAGASFTNPSMSANFMSPYMQNVVDAQKREAIRDADIATTQRNAQAVKAGAFGGSRQAIMDAEANRNLMTNLSDIQGRGLQSAYESGRQQFNTEFGQQMDTTNLLNQLGGQRQQLGQRQLDQQFADFQAQRDYPYQQLGFLSDILRGVSGSTRTMYSSQPQASGLQQLAGLGTAAAGFGKLFKEGGIVDGYAAGGAIAQPQQLTAQLSQMSDQALQGYAQMHKDDPYTVSLAIAESRRRQQLRQAAANAQDVEPKQGTVIERELEGIAAAAPQIEYADGGLVSYADGGALEEQRMSDREGIAKFGRAVWEQMKRAGAAIADVGTLPVRGLAGAYDTAVVRPMRAAGLDAGYISPYLVPEGADVDSMTPFYDQFRRQEKTPPVYYGNEGRRTPAPPMAEGLAAAAPAQMPAPAEETPPSRTPPVSGGVGSRSSRSAGAGLGALVPDMGADKVVAEGERRIGEMSAEERRVLEGEKADMEQRFKEQGVFGEQREKRLKEREAGLDGKERDAKNMALIQAGLAILSADPSRGALAAIGEGALKGVGAYKGDMEKIEAQREGIGEKMDELLELRRQESSARGEKLAEIRSRIRGVERDAKKSTFELWKGVGVPLKAKEREMAFQAALKQREIEASQANARIAAGGRNNTLEIAREYAASKKIPLHQAIQEISAKGGGFDVREAYAEYLKTPAATLNPLSFDAFSRQFAPTMGAGTPNIDLSKWGKPTLVPQ